MSFCVPSRHLGDSTGSEGLARLQKVRSKSSRTDESYLLDTSQGDRCYSAGYIGRNSSTEESADGAHGAEHL